MTIPYRKNQTRAPKKGVTKRLRGPLSHYFEYLKTTYPDHKKFLKCLFDCGDHNSTNAQEGLNELS